jgi:hypothetical protein
MNIAEILRGLADIVDRTDQAAPAQQPVVININNGEAETPAMPATDSDQETTADEVMIPPLQQKIELMKKMAGEESAYDPIDDQTINELDIIKQNAGLKPVVAITADEDEPFEG